MTLRRAAPSLLALVIIAGGARASAAEPAPLRFSTANALRPSPALMRAVNEAWETLDPARAAPFYAREPGRVFFDVAPLESRGWEAYAAGAAKTFEAMRSMRITLHPGAEVHVSGRSAWGTATMRYDIRMRDGSRVERDARWTVVWEKRGAAWLIVHEHVSFPGAAP